jgi:hypothetical protein
MCGRFKRKSDKQKVRQPVDSDYCLYADFPLLIRVSERIGDLASFEDDLRLLEPTCRIHW